jgi:hypothetical protein
MKSPSAIWRVLTLFIIGTVGANILYHLYWSEDARKARHFLHSISTGEIQEVCIEPVPYDANSLCSSLILVKDPAKITQLATLIQSAKTCSPNHPHEKWAVSLSFKLKNETYSGRVESTVNQGVLFWYGWGPDGGWIYTTLRQDSLGPVIEALVPKR